MRGDHAWLGCGGGIVADSDPASELREAYGKAAPIAAALGSRVIADVPGEVPPSTLPAWPDRPDPAAGLLETIAVRDGRAVDADAHLARLAASARELYGLELPEIVLAPARADGRLRVLARPRDGALAVEVEEHPLGEPPAPVTLEPRVLAGGLGRHKWLDRRQDPAWLAVDLDGSVLEGAWANVWALLDGSLLTPPDDGRLLPGVTRARLLRRPDAREAPLTLADLARAEAIVLTSSVRLATPAGLSGPPSPRAVELAAELRRDPALWAESHLVHSPIRRRPDCSP